MRLKFFAILAVGMLLCAGLVSANAQNVSNDKTKIIHDNFESLQSLLAVINSIKAPDIATPGWLQAEIDAELAAKAAAELARQQAIKAAATATPVSNKAVTYSVEIRGAIIADLSEFKSLANQTLNDGRGWARLGLSFQEVASGGSFTLVLSEAGQVPTFSNICSIYWSCSVGRYVVINQDRWLYASDAWNGAGGSLRDYRNMVINHETGHWLGHGHAVCGGAGQPAPVMQQQSIDLQGCNFNPWPLNSELWSNL